MKKALAILLALALVGGAVFAQDAAKPAVVKLEEPVITSGVSAYFGHNVLVDNTVAKIKDGVADVEADYQGLFGGSVTDPSGVGGLFVQPWVRLAQGPFSARFQFAHTDGANRYDLTLGAAGTGYSLTNRIRMTGGNVSTLVTGSVDKDNLSAAAVFGGASVAANLDNYLVGSLATLTLTDFRFQIANLWDFATVKVGGYNNSYYHTNHYRYTAIGNFMWRSSSNQDQGFRWKGVLGTSVPVNTTFALGKKIEALPLTIKTGVNVPLATVEYRDFLAQNNIIAAAEYVMADVGKFALGWIPAFAYTEKTEAAGVYTLTTPNTTNTIFFDANLSMVENLQLQAAFDFKAATAADLTPASTTGTGAAATPFVTKKYTINTINFGVEGIYDLSSMMAGLTAELALAVAARTGETALNSTGTAWATPTTGAGIYNAANYTEANVYGARKNFVLGLRADYEINETNSVYFSNTFTNSAAAFAAVGAYTARGFYNTNAIGLGYTVKAGKGSLALDAGYTMFLGLPTAANLGITAANDVEAYKVALANEYKPLSFTIMYTGTY